jgi:hypothetical protein
MTNIFSSPISTLFSRRQGCALSPIFLLIAVFISSAASANEFELSRLANEIRAASSLLAQDLKYSRGFGSVGQRADRLARDSAQLVDAIGRRRSASNIRSQYADVSQRYGDLEDAFFRASRNYSDDQVFNQMNLISALFSDLSAEYYYSPFYNSRTSVITVVNPVVVHRRATNPHVFLSHGGRSDRRHENSFNSVDASNARHHYNSDRTTAAGRLGWVEGHNSGHRIIRIRPERLQSTRRRDN